MEKRIVFITTPGHAKRCFLNTLQGDSHGAVALVVIQTPRTKSISERLRTFFKKVGWSGILPELYHALCLRIRSDLRHTLEYVKETSFTCEDGGMYDAPTLTTSDINSDVVAAAIREANPSVIAIWGGLILKPHIIKLAPISVNMHTGFCPFYRGTNCNLNALLNNDMAHIGITLHRVVPTVDAGDIFEIITADAELPPRALFRDLNDRAIAAYRALIVKLQRGEAPPTTSQDISLGKNYLLREWTYTKQHRAARMLKVREEEWADTHHSQS